MISIKTLKKDFPELNKFKDEDLEKPLESFPVNNSYYLGRMIDKSGYIILNYRSVKDEYYNGTKYSYDPYRIADFIAAYEIKRGKDDSYSLMDENQIGPIIKSQVFNYLRELSGGLYDPEPQIAAGEEAIKRKQVYTLNRIKAVTRAAISYGIPLDEVLSVVEETYGGKEE